MLSLCLWILFAALQVTALLKRQLKGKQKSGTVILTIVQNLPSAGSFC